MRGEYFGHQAFYVKPNDLPGIRQRGVGRLGPGAEQEPRPARADVLLLDRGREGDACGVRLRLEAAAGSAVAEALAGPLRTLVASEQNGCFPIGPPLPLGEGRGEGTPARAFNPERRSPPLPWPSSPSASMSQLPLTLTLSQRERGP